MESNSTYYSFFAVLLNSHYCSPIAITRWRQGKIQYIPQWIAVIPALCSIFLIFFQSESVVTNIKVISSTILLFFLFLHLGLAKPLHEIYNQTVVGNAIRTAQEQGEQVAIFPARLADQFQFAGRLHIPLLPKVSMDTIKKWAVAHPYQFRVIFTKKNGPLKKGDTMRQYSNGWLIFGSAEK